jgi:flagellar secretion chaperone FliS
MDDKTNKGPKNPSASSVGTYRKTHVMTANKETILLMMYSGAIRFVKRAITASEANQIEEKAQFVSKTQEIITELRSTLNFDVGGDIAKQLDGLYAYLSRRLAEGSTENNVNHFKEVLTILSTLNEGWEQAIDTLRKERGQKLALDK